jgi:uncharacterized membrane protein YgdD (TMEM256/DUF423 family)
LEFLFAISLYKTSMHRNYLITASVFGVLAVALGAFGAHGLEQITDNEKILNSFRTGVQYQIYHALALLAVAIIYERRPNRWIRWAGTCFVTGIILFSGSLYFLAFLKVQELSVKFVGPLTPLGGMFLIAGWLCLVIGVARRDSER